MEGLIQKVQAIADESARRSAVEAIQALLELHGEGLQRMLQLAGNAGEPGQALVMDFGRDDNVGGLLMLHGLHPLSLDDRVGQALEKVRPYLASHGGNVELMGLEGGVVRLRLEGSCHGCPSSAMTLKYAIEEGILEAAPDVMGIEVEGAVEEVAPAGFVPLSEVRGAPPLDELGWELVTQVESLKNGDIKVTNVAGTGVLFARLDSNWYAYRDRCPSCGKGLAGASLDAVVLTCACGHQYDLRFAGRCLELDQAPLRPLPLLAQGGEVRVAAGAAAG